MGLFRNLLWAGLVVAVAAYGSMVVRNVTDTLVGITAHQPMLVIADRPNR